MEIQKKEGSTALICGHQNQCEEFDGDSSSLTPPLKYQHGAGCLAYYDSSPTVVGRRLTFPACISFEESLLTVGGYDSRAGYIDEVWMLKNLEWLLSGHLNHVVGGNTLLHRGNWIYSFPGWTSSDRQNMFTIERFQLVEDTVIEEVVAIYGEDQAFEYPYPLVLQVPVDFCL